MSLIMEAARFAAEAHAGQTRKYTGTPYIMHPARVAAYVCLLTGATVEMVVAAFLHDVLEDTAVTLDMTVARFGERVGAMVQALTNPSKDSKEPRHVRKKQDREWLSRQSDEVKKIKMLDRIDNLMEMRDAPEGFRIRYVEESELLAEAIGDADSALKGWLLYECRKIRGG